MYRESRRVRLPGGEVVVEDRQQFADGTIVYVYYDATCTFEVDVSEYEPNFMGQVEEAEELG